MSSFLVGSFYCGFLFFLGGGLLLVGFLVGNSRRSYSREPISTYECGFQSVISARIPFSLNFYLLGVIFLLFDVELVIIFPYFFLSPGGQGCFVFCYVFFAVLLFGLVHECNEGSLDWC